MFCLLIYGWCLLTQAQSPPASGDATARSGSFIVRTEADADLRQRIIALGREQVDDARFRAEVRRLVGEPIEPTDLMVRLRGTLTNPWVIFGLGAQALFMMRFVVQWVVSERRKRSVIPVSFWWLSLAGGVSLAAYALHRRDPVFLLGQTLGCVIYTRNLLLIRRRAGIHRNTLEVREQRVAADADVPSDNAMAGSQVPAEASSR